MEKRTHAAQPRTYRGLRAIAARLGCSVASASRLVKAKAIRHRRLGVSSWLIETDEAAVQEYLDARTVERVAA